MTSEAPRVVVASVQGRASISPATAARLDDIADVTYLAREQRFGAAEARLAFRDADVVAVTPKVAPTFDEQLLRALPRLRGLSLYATGYDFIDVDLLARHQVELSILPDYSTVSVAEHTIGLMLAVSRRIHLGNDRSRGVVPPSTSLRGFELAGRTLGIIGCGRIGRRVARLARGFEMRTIAYDIAPEPVDGVRYVSRAELLATSDVVTLHCPMYHGAPPIVGAPEIEAMPREAVLINASRAALVDHDAVVEALRSGHLRGYAVDDTVFAGPGVDDLLTQGRIVQTDHSAWWSDEVLARGARMWGEHILGLVTGEPADLVTDGDGSRVERGAAPAWPQRDAVGRA